MDRRMIGNSADGYRAMYVYAWDVLDLGVTGFVDNMLAMGITDVAVAASYHAGKFLRPHAKQGPRVIFPEDGVVYFSPRADAYGEIAAHAHSDASYTEVLAALLADGRIRVHAWTVLLHNSRLGSAFPEYCARNAFGDPYVYSLCPMHDAVLAYAVNLCADVSTQHSLHSLVLESPGWLPYAHGYHHEFAQVRSNIWLDDMLGLCFCAACRQAARAKQIDVDGLQNRVARAIDTYLESDIDATHAQASAWLQSEILHDGDLQQYLRMRQDRVTELVAQIKTVLPAATSLAVIPTVQRPTAHSWAEGSDLAALAEVADFIEVPFYEPDANAIGADAWYTLRQVQSSTAGTGKIRAILRPGPPDLGDGIGFSSAFQRLKEMGIRHFAFYNYGLLRQSKLNMLAATLAAEKVVS